MKKIKFNRFNIIIFSVAFVLLLLFVFAFFNSYSDYVTKPKSKIEGDTVYINDLASDYYYYLGMNYVGDLNSNQTNYQESDLKMVTINYFGYNLSNPDDIGYVSLNQNERQNKFVYYKYFPVKNGQITFDLIDNPFIDRPRKKGFAGWSSSDGTISTDANTKVQRITINSSTDTVNVYANWQKANVIYLKGENGDDNFNGLTPDNAVSSFGRAFQLLENNATNNTRDSRDLNIIVLIGDVSYSLNYTQQYTHTWNNVNYSYNDKSWDEEVLIAYQNGSDLYALNDNWSNVSTVALTNSSEPPQTAFWLIKKSGNGYTIQNENTERYLGAVQYYNTQIVLNLTTTPYVWSYDTSLKGFYSYFEVTMSKYTYQNNNSFTSGNSYLITSGNNPINALNYNSAIDNLILDEYNYVNTLEWQIQNVNNNIYTIYNVGRNQYLTYSNANNEINLTLGNANNWIYDGSTRSFSTSVTHRIVTYSFSTSNLASRSNIFLGNINGNSANVIGSLNNDLVLNTYTNSSGISRENNNWEVTSSGNGYRIRNTSAGRYLVRSGSNVILSTSNSGGTWTYDTTYHVLYQRTNGWNSTYYYLAYNNGNFETTQSRNSALSVYIVNQQESVNQYTDTMYLSFDNDWKLETSNTNSSVSFTTYTSEQITDNIPFYINYDSNNFSISANSNNSTLRFLNYTVSRNMVNTSSGGRANNNYYSSGTNIPATVTSLYNHIDYRNNATWNLTSGSYSQVIAYNDLQLEYLRVDAYGYQSIDDAETTTYYGGSYASFIGNGMNTRIGRGMTPSSWSDSDSSVFAYLQGASNDTTVGSTYNTNNAYRFVVESGRYSGLMALRINNNYSGNSYYNYYGQTYLTMGSDYDRATENNSLLDVYYRMGSSNYHGINGTGDYHDIAYLMTIKSGTIGMNYFDNNTNAARGYAGIYVGGLTVQESTNQTDDISSRVLIVEGGNIANINGGLRLTETRGNNGVTTRIYVKNGNVQNIVGGAGVSTTYGDRFISVTGGNIAYSISGGSNGVAATDESGQSGRLGGDSYVHVGGEAHIGTKGSGTLYEVSYGSVLGAGNGNEDFQTSGRVNTSHVYISGNAIIEGNVYGGGNFGPVLEDSNITIDGATIKGNVYGGANKNGVGTVAINESTIYNVSFDDNKELTNGQTYLINKINGNTRNLLSENSSQNTYNVSLAEGNEPSDYSRWLITSAGDGYTIKNSYYNYYLGYTTSNPPRLTINTNTNNSIWKYDNTNKTFYSDITYLTSTNINYSFTNNITNGGEYLITNTNNASSAYSLNDNIARESLSTTEEPTNNVWIFNASGNGYTIRNKESGEYLSLGSGWSASLTTSNTPTVWTWNASNRRLSAVFEGWFSDTTYYLRYYNNNWSISTSNYSVYLATYNITGTEATNRYYLVFDSTWKLSTTASNISLSTFTSTSTTGYSTSNKSDGDVSIIMNNGNVNGAIYGGSCETGNIAGTVTININGGNIGADDNDGSIFGGGFGEDTFVATGVNLNISDAKNVKIDGTAYGGSALGTIIGSVNVRAIDNSGNGTITVDGDFYCGSMGDADVSSTGTVQGSCTLSLDGGTYNGSVFGGNNANGSPTGNVTVTTGGNNTTTISNVYGGGNEADSIAANVTVNIENKSIITNAFGGGNKAKVSNTNVNLHGGNVTNIYGGSNQMGDITTSTITATGGNAVNVFGGNNLGGTTMTSTINANGSTITNIYGGGNEAPTGTTNVNLNSGTITNTFGGGNMAGITNSTNINVNGATCTTIYGGSNTSGNVPESNIKATMGSADTIYGGNNLGGKTIESNVIIEGITVGTVYGGGKRADTGETNVLVSSGTITNLYGGGESANVDTSTNVNITGGTTTNAYGGSNQNGTIPISNIHVTGGTIDTIYGGNNAGGTTTTTNVLIDNGTITNIYGGGSKANSTTTNVTLNNSTNEISYIFGGCKEANATTTNVTLNNGRASRVFGGSNTSGTITDSYVTINNGTYKTIYGGNNDGGTTTTTHVNDLGGNVNVIFGGGNNATSGDVNVIIDGATVSEAIYGGGNNASVESTNVDIINSSTVEGNVYGGGNNGEVLEDTIVDINNSYIMGNLYAGGNYAAVRGDTKLNLVNSASVRLNLYGGGNNGQVLGSTDVDIKNSTVSGSAYAGGNGETAIVNQNTCITVEGTSNIVNHVFGGGNAAATGLSANDNSHGTVNIAGATIGGNVYGGANTSILYGETVVNIGIDAVTSHMNNNDYLKGNISIGGTVFGGGEANASGSEVYDFDFISVTKGIIINIDGNSHSVFDIDGSIFGSGNASRTTGYSRIYINNYGSDSNIKNNVSLQRADIAVLNNSHIALSGTTDRTNEYSQVVFSLSRITELDLKNNSEIYLENGANLLNRFRSLNSDNTIASVTINEDTHSVSRSTNNRLYILEDKVLNIALNQNVTAYGEVDGMTFFGMFKRDRNGNIVKAMYNTNYSTGSTPLEGEMYYFNSGSYVLGKHETNHNIKVDGFYTNYDDPDNPGKILVDYITPSPDDAEHYMWTIGVSVQSYDIELIASKYSTLGTYEFPFINNANGNTTFSIVGFNYDELNSNVSLVNPDNIPRIAASGEQADNNLGLAIKPGIGWITVGETYFLTDSSNLYGGTTHYKTENSNITPSFVFYLYHSKNLQTEGYVGNVIVSLLVVTPIDDLTNDVQRINFNITITRAIFDSNEYEGAMTPGRQYEMFTSSKMDITSKSSLSAYYSLFTESERTIYHEGYHRVLTSNVILPVNTKITMIDFASATKPEYYYYIVNAEDNALLASSFASNGEVEYELSKFIRMGSLDQTNKYDNEVANAIYYDNNTHVAVEEFIFIVDFKNANITSDMLNCSLLIEMMDRDNNILHSVLGIQRSNLVYNLHANHQSVIDVSAEVSKSLVYAGDVEDLRVTVNFNQSDENSSNRIVDTTYYEQKLGLKISFFDERGYQINGVDLMGTSLTLDGNTYYARSDGTFRFKIADKVANSYSNIKINTTNSSLSSGNYTVKVETFYSVDGIYFGSTPVDYDDVTFRLMSRTYGLQVLINDGELIINKKSGKNDLENNKMNITVNYTGALIEPNLKVALYRRTYNNIYDTTYTSVDLSNYLSDTLTLYSGNVYNLISELSASNNISINFKDTPLMTGTYKLEFRLYDGASYVGDVVKYIVIK